MDTPDYRKSTEYVRDTSNRDRAILKIGMQENGEAWREWKKSPKAVITPWLLGSLCIALILLTATLVLSYIASGDSPQSLVAVNDKWNFNDAAFVWTRNALVLLLHSLVCVATYLARRTLPLQARSRRGIDRWVHHHTPRAAVWFVIAATIFSLSTQAWALGQALANIGQFYGVNQALVLLCVLPHALLELTAIFLPLAATLMLARKGQYNSLLAVVGFCALFAIPAIIVAGIIEISISPLLGQWLLIR